MKKLRIIMIALLGLLPAAAAQDWVGTVPAPDFPPGLDWLNTERPLSLADLRGRIVLLDFWTYGCINCIHVIPELRALQEKYLDVLTVIGVHSAKFTNEADTANIRVIADRYGREEPLVNDLDFTVWRSYGMNAWPGFILVDPEGNIVGRHSGEGIYDLFDDVIETMVHVFDARGSLVRGVPDFGGDPLRPVRSALLYPGKVLADEGSGRVFISDTGNNRVVVADFSGLVLAVIGSGRADLVDGTFAEAAFNAPQGLTLDETGRLYVADTGNHSVRRADLEAGTVTTVAGQGRQEYMFGLSEVDGLTHGLNSPWDVLWLDGSVFTAMAGQHQLWRFDPGTSRLYLHAGSGRELLTDGELRKGGLNQPSGLSSDGQVLFVADAEASAIRSADVAEGGHLRTLVGTGLFDFGDVDGRGDEVRLQHPLGVAWDGSGVWIADTYNHSLKYLDPEGLTVRRVFGTGTPGFTDGAAGEAAFYEPGGLSWAHGVLFVADTNNHSIRIADPESGSVGSLELRDPEGLLAAPRPRAEEAFDEVVTLPGAVLQPGSFTFELTVTLPDGYTANHLAPLTLGLASDSPAVTVETPLLELREPDFPLTLTAEASAEEGAEAGLSADLSVYYCEETARQVCLIRQVRFLLPVRFSAADADASGRVEAAWQAPALP